MVIPVKRYIYNHSYAQFASFCPLYYCVYALQRTDNVRWSTVAPNSLDQNLSNLVFLQMMMLEILSSILNSHEVHCVKHSHTPSCERSFSCLKRLKSYLRSTMSDERLNSLAVISIERDFSFSLSLDDIVDKFNSMDKNRRMLLS